MTIGTRARLARLGRDDAYVVVPMDHGLTMGPVTGLRDIESTIDAVTRGGADAVLTQKGMAERVHPNKNEKGYIVHLNGSTTIGPDTQDKRVTGTVEEAIRAGADAVSIHLNIGSEHEHRQLEDLAQVSERAARFGMPVLAMCYVRGHDVEATDPDQLAHAVRIGEELGADLIKTAYSGDARSFETVTSATTKPVLIAGGKPDTDRETLAAVRGAMDGGGAGVSMGRSIFQHDDPEAMTRAVAGVVHDDLSAAAALERAGLTVEA